MPQYNKVFNVGTYTGNGGHYRVGVPTLRGVGPTGTQVANSLRFRAVSYLNRTPSVASNRSTWTWSGWVKRGTLGNQVIFSAGVNGSSSGLVIIQFESTDALTFYVDTGTNNFKRTTTQLLKDCSKWYHIVCVLNTTQATATNRLKVYIDGSEITSFSTSTNPDLNSTYAVNNTQSHNIGRYVLDNGRLFSGYLAEVNLIDGQALTSSSFGEYNSDNIWVPKAFSGTYGTNGFYLKFASGAVGTDSSGNGNTWTLNSFNTTTSNTTYDLLTDSPTDYGTDTGAGAQVRGTYATMNSLFNTGGQALISDAGLTATRSTSVGFYNIEFSHFPMSSGKWYWEVTIGGTADIQIGATTSIPAERTAGVAGASASGYVYQNYSGNKKNNGSAVAYGSTSTANDVIGVALDMDNGKIWWSKNGVWQASGDPAAGTNAAYTGITGTAYPEVGDAGATLMTGYMNFGQRAYSYTAPSGFKSLCSANITRPADSALWFYGDAPDLIWIKNRSTTASHGLTDTVRGMGLNLVTNSSAAETSYPGVTEMNKFGMTVINDATTIPNGSTNSHVYWGWKAGGTSVTNTSGSITSQVSANPSTGFSIVTWTHNGSTGTIGHGLGAVPSMIIAKTRSGVNDFFVYHKNLSATPQNSAVYLNLTNSIGTTSVIWNNTAPTSSVFSAASTFSTNTCVAYLWAAIPGYSAFGSYTGNGSSDGPFIYTGFRPRFVITKGSSIAYNWKIFDSARNPTNPVTLAMWTDLSNADTSGTAYCDFYSNGFKMRDTDPVTNNSGSTYIYLAFAEIPFKFARSR